MHKLLWLLTLCLICGCGAPPTAVDINSLLGRWEVDFERTLEAGKQSPTYNEQTAERMSDMIKRMMETMSIELTESAMIYHRGGTSISFPFVVVASKGNSVTVSLTGEEEETNVVFTFVEGDYLQFTSSASDDMDYYVWKRGGPPVLGVMEY